MCLIFSQTPKIHKRTGLCQEQISNSLFCKHLKCNNILLTEVGSWFINICLSIICINGSFYHFFPAWVFFSLGVLAGSKPYKCQCSSSQQDFLPLHSSVFCRIQVLKSSKTITGVQYEDKQNWDVGFCSNLVM